MKESSGITKFLWSESLTRHLDRNPLKAAAFLTFAVWLSGLAAFVLGSKSWGFILDVPTYGFVFVFIPASLFGVRYLRNSFLKEVDGFGKHVNMPKEKYQAVRIRLNNLLCYFPAVAFIAIILGVLFDTNIPKLYTYVATGQLSRFDSAFLWTLGLSALDWLLFATVIWVVLSIWIGVYIVSKQPLNFKPTRFSDEFLPLSRFDLKVTGFYFIALTIPGLLNLYVQLVEQSARTGFDPLQLAFFFILILPGVLGFLTPLYNIHRTLKKAKWDELKRIDDEIHQQAVQLQQLQMAEPGNMQDYAKASSQYMRVSASLLSLLTLERSVNEVDDWPILDHTMLTGFMVLILLPVIINILTNNLP
jgi:hypothetical protein